VSFRSCSLTAEARAGARRDRPGPRRRR
jgi:hypothetical protein